MNEASAAADQLTREGLQAAEMAAKLTALGAKNLAALVMALLKDNEKLAGKTNLKRLLRDGKELKVIPLSEEKRAAFSAEAKRYGVLFSVIHNKESGDIDVLVRAEDAAKINRIFERIGYNGLSEPTEDAAKKQAARAPRESVSQARGQSWSDDIPLMDMTEKSVRKRLEQLRRGRAPVEAPVKNQMKER